MNTADMITLTITGDTLAHLNTIVDQTDETPLQAVMRLVALERARLVDAGHARAKAAKRPRMRKLIRVGQRLVRWDGQRGYVDLNSQGVRVYGPGETFRIHWQDEEGNFDGDETAMLETLEELGITWGNGVMRWAR
jgi:hypothetical protein